jgi:tRNA modification GTPase
VFSPTDTIVALATAPAPAGIGVVRISGPSARRVACAILTVPHDLEPRHATLTHVIGTASHCLESPIPNPQSPIPNPQVRHAPIDEVVATLFPAPHSYTAEDVVEISAHGSVALLGEILRAAIAAGARLAEPGEFTLRAFLNGRIDLVQAEAVADLVDAVTPLQARVAFDQLDGTLTRAIGALDEQLFDLAARLEASVDFPEEGYHFVARGEAAVTLARVRDGIDALLATSAAGRLIREGRHIAILGKPNVGKSSLFNELVGTDRAIVAAGPGTTRDMLRETIDLDGLRLGLVDTAGIRVSEDEVEQEGVVRARRAADAADLVILVLDRSRLFEDIDIALIRETASAPRLIVINKIDLPAAWTPGDLAAGISPTPNPKTGVVHLSLKTREGLDELRAAVRAALDAVEPLRDAVMVTNVRHETLLRQARESLARAIANIDQAGAPTVPGASPSTAPAASEMDSEELVLADIADARHAFEEVTGKRTNEDVLRRIFERFCIGK